MSSMVDHMQQNPALFIVILALLAAMAAWNAWILLTLRKKRREAREGERRLRALGDHLPRGAIFELTLKPDKRVIVNHISAGVEELLGVSAESIITDPEEFSGRVHPEDLADVKRMAAAAVESRSCASIETRVTGRAGEIIWVLVNACPVFEASSGGVVWVGYVFDVTNRKEAEEERQNIDEKIMTQSKLASLGEIAAGVAHEINQPLTFINGILQLSIVQLRSGDFNQEEAADSFAKAVKSAGHINEIINHLRTFGRKESECFERIRLDDILRETLILMGERIRLRNITLKTEVEEPLPGVNGSQSQLEQIFINLFQNSIDALSGRKDGVITIKMRRKDGDLIVNFMDNGPGIPAEIREKIFDSFFTTKRPGKGTGLGLSIVKSIVTKHDGDISCSSADDGKGVDFELTLPLYDENSRKESDGK